MTQQPKRLPGELNPVPDADAAVQPVCEAQALGMESLAMGAGMLGGPFGTGEGGIVRSVVALVNRRKRRRDVKRSP
ncbi:MAG: hypothetical protein ABWY81_04485 [Jiangellaceae bacterium]